MQQPQLRIMDIAVSEPPRLAAGLRVPQRLRSTAVGLGIAAVFLAGSICAAQEESSRLTVRPREMKIPAENPKAGEYIVGAPSVSTGMVEDTPEGVVAVPAQCAGAHRCPLLVQLPGGGQSAQHMADWLHPVANKYGFILLTLSNYEPATVDSILKGVLQKFSIDPEKIAIAGRCASGGAAMRFGIENLEVFNRIASVSGAVPIDGMDPKNTTAEFFLDRAFRESEGSVFDATQALRRAGHRVKQMMGLRGHEDQIEDYDMFGRWLAESWAKPDTATRVQPAVVADPLPELTPDVLAKMTAFWKSFLHEPDSIWTEVRQAHLREVVVPIGTERPVVVMTDMAAIAAKFPSVAADLQKAGLTAQQHDAYRVALIAAQVTPLAEGSVGTIDPIMAKNVAYFNAHQDQFDALETAGVDDPSRVPGEMVWRDTPAVIKTFGPMGIWRSP